MLAFIWGITKLCHALDCWKSSLFFLLLSFYIFCINEIAIGEQLKSWPIAKISISHHAFDVFEVMHTSTWPVYRDRHGDTL